MAKQTQKNYITNLQGSLMAKNKQSRMAENLLQEFKEHLHSDKFSGVDADGERKDWISTKDVWEWISQIQNALVVPIDYKICQDNGVEYPILPEEADKALDDLVTRFSQRRLAEHEKVGSLIGGYYRITSLGSHTVEFKTVDGWTGAIQVPFVDANGNPTMAGMLAAAEIGC